jgi:hypothetical protein
MTQFSSLAVGEILSETQYYKVLQKTKTQVQLETDTGEKIVIDKPYVELLQSASQSTSEEKVSKTAATEIFKAASFQAVTVNFNKQVKEADVVKEIVGAYETSTPKGFAKAVKDAVKRSNAGEERTMVGRHFGAADDFGRIHFIDMNIPRGKADADYDVRQRLVDPRTINWVIINGVKYTVK